MKEFKYNRKDRNRKSKEEGSIANRLLDSGIGKVVLIIVSILMILSVYRSFKQMGQKVSLLKQAEQEVRSLRLENLNLSLQVEKAGSITTLEKEARNRLNYGQEGELIFVIGEDLVEVGKEKIQAILYPEEQESQEDVLDEWLDFLVTGY
ncbi:MAG: septum formation initiator family protein [Candidatus Dojkabacteria bacterium]|jgi:cell division protein FtsB|nr:septum formation initiator family protein [Candidatus Dojkabacteria bacterium]MDD2270350.1 septum formation initiator family protein [Candidatus Dojkabacteria bacterium]